MAIRNDYLLDMIAQFVDGIMAGVGKQRAGLSRDALGEYEGVVGRVLDMDGDTALELSPASLLTMMQLSAVDEGLAVYAVYSLERAAEIYDQQGDATSRVRHEQARAIAQAYGFPVSCTPRELEEALAASGC